MTGGKREIQFAEQRIGAGGRRIIIAQPVDREGQDVDAGCLQFRLGLDVFRQFMDARLAPTGPQVQQHGSPGLEGNLLRLAV